MTRSKTPFTGALGCSSAFATRWRACGCAAPSAHRRGALAQTAKKDNRQGRSTVTMMQQNSGDGIGGAARPQHVPGTHIGWIQGFGRFTTKAPHSTFSTLHSNHLRSTLHATSTRVQRVSLRGGGGAAAGAGQNT